MHSLLEMVLAIAIAGIIFAAAIIPTTQTIAAYQAGEAEVRQAALQNRACVRPEQVIEKVWRDAAPPDGYDALGRAQAAELTIGAWALRESGGRFEQNRDGAGWSPIAEPVENLAFSYLGRSGIWVNSVDAADFDNVLAVRFNWTDAAAGRAYRGLGVLPDRCFAGGRIDLSPPDTSKAYQRADYTRKFSISLGEWQ
jgi:hypothetical protein